MTSSRGAKNSPSERRDSFLSLLIRKRVDAAIVSDPRHVYYFTGYSTFWPRSTSLLILTREMESCLFLSESRVADAKKVYDGRIATFEDYALSKRMIAYGNFVAEELTKLLKGEKTLRGSRRIGLEDWYIPDVYAQAVKFALPKARLIGIANMILSYRVAKGEDELRNLREATERLDLAYEIARTNIAVGKSEIELCRDVMSDSISRHGSFEFSRGDTWISGERTLQMAGPPSDRRFREGDSIILDLQSVAKGYWADGARTYIVGKATEEQERIFNALLEAKRKAEELLKPGTACKDVYNIVAKEIDNAGFSGMFPHHAGHGVGLEDQEAPFFIPGSKQKLEKGVVCTIEPGIYNPHVGGFRDEDTYIITADGFEKITTPMTKLEQIS